MVECECADTPKPSGSCLCVVDGEFGNLRPSLGGIADAEALLDVAASSPHAFANGLKLSI
jgi:hypothetical protein